ncbi:MAG: NAD(P)/FAD-dependent oxidoreductase [Candidatus Promineifilaceae bacterium]|nr:NAD(P)/FAD-dependent oxidoreductase [Candidatus Promineifilaceae bacterium]
MSDRRIRIAGAGPSGLTAAINLARAGYAVEVFEKRPDTGKRFHGDIQGLENWSDEEEILDALARMNIAINFDCDPFLKLIITNGQKTRVSHYDTPLCYLVKRGANPGTLDQGLKQQALEAGAKLHFGQALPLEEADIAATGPISKEIFAVDKGIVFQTDYEDTNVFLLNDDAAYKGYSYLLITKGYGCLCTVLFDRFTDLDDNYEAAKRMLLDMFDFDIRQPQDVAGVGCFSTRNVYQRDNTLFVGEAAGLQDLMWGFGIKTAVESGYLAARCIIEGKDYRTEAERLFGPRLKATLVDRWLWEIIRFKDYQLVVSDSLNKGGRRAFDLSFLYNFSPLHRLAYPVARWAMRRRYPNLRI